MFQIFVPVRTNSNRLPEKHLRQFANGKTMLENLISEIRLITDAQINLIAPNGQTIFEEFKQLADGIAVYYGDEQNVLDRFMTAVSAAKMDRSHFAIRINGDAFGICEELFQKTVYQIEKSKKNVITTVGGNVPSGLHIECVKVQFLELIDYNKLYVTDYEKEHIFPLFYRLVDSQDIIENDDKISGKFSVDTYQDFVVADAFVSSEKKYQEFRCWKNSYRTNFPFIGTHGPFLIAEVGGNHEGNFDYAKKLISEACETEVDAVKLQIYNPDLLVNKLVDRQRWEHFNKFALKTEQYIELLDIIRASGKKTCASIWSLEEIETFGNFIDILKVGSGDFTDKSIISKLVTLNKPLVVSTGLCEAQLVDEIISYISDLSIYPSQVAILQCTAMYPITESQAHLNVIEQYKQNYSDFIIGYSDHTIGLEALADAVILGAEVLEFHYSDDTLNDNFRDHLVSLDKGDVALLIEKIKRKKLLLGSKYKTFSFQERSRKHADSFRKAVYLRHDIKVGQRVSRDDIITLRPNIGIDAKYAENLVNKKAKFDISALQPLSWEAFE